MTPEPSRATLRLVALQHRDFRLLWVGQSVSIIGSQMQNTAVLWQINTLLRGQVVEVNLFNHAVTLDAAALGLGGLGLTRIIPIAIFALIGGSFADAHDRRKILAWSQVAALVLAALLAALTLTGNETLATIYLISAAMTATVAFANPARQSIIPNLVPREHYANAVSLGTMAMNIGMMAGPALAGIAIAVVGVGWVYALNAASFVAVLVAVALMRYRGQPKPSVARPGLRSIIEGFRFVVRAPMIWGTMLLDFIATFFSSASTMLPLVASEMLHVGPEGYGLLATAPAVGSVITSVVLSLRRNIHRQGLAMLASVCVYGAATALFGLSTLFAASYLFYLATGAADTVSMVIRNLIRQLNTPDFLRGRMTGVNMIFAMGGPQLGELEAGALASVFGVPFAIVSGGLATIAATLWVAWKFPRLRRYTLDDNTPDADLAAAPGVATT